MNDQQILENLQALPKSPQLSPEQFIRKVEDDAKTGLELIKNTGYPNVIQNLTSYAQFMSIFIGYTVINFPKVPVKFTPAEVVQIAAVKQMILSKLDSINNPTYEQFYNSVERKANDGIF